MREKKNVGFVLFSATIASKLVWKLSFEHIQQRRHITMHRPAGAALRVRTHPTAAVETQHLQHACALGLRQAARMRIA